MEYDYERESGREYDPKRGGLVEKEGTTMFKTTGTPTEQVVNDGLVLSTEDFTNLAANIYSAMPEDVRRKVVENAARADYDLKKATFQMVASLAEKKNLSDSRREVSEFLQIIHRYRDNMLAKIKNPVENGVLEIDPAKAVEMEHAGYGEVEHVAIFDEAQRTWTHERLANYLKRGGTYGNKLKVPNFPVSEAAFLIWSLDQRKDWAVIICLVGGGQEINTGELELRSGSTPSIIITLIGRFTFPIN